MIVVHLMPYYQSIDGRAAASREQLVRRWSELAPDGWELRTAQARGQPVSVVRDRLVRVALQQDADLVLWQDSDVSFDATAALRLLQHVADHRDDGAAIAAAPLAVQTGEAFRLRPNLSLSSPALADVGRDRVQTSEQILLERLEWPVGPAHQDRPFEVARIGMALMAVDARAYMAIDRPWHEWRAVAGASLEEDDDVLGEDFGFCDQVRRLGRTVWCLPAAKATHWVTCGLVMPRWETGAKWNAADTDVGRRTS